jgi:hypothetical protein
LASHRVDSVAIPHQSGDWTGDRFIPANFACWDGLPYRRSNNHVIAFIDILRLLLVYETSLHQSIVVDLLQRPAGLHANVEQARKLRHRQCDDADNSCDQLYHGAVAAELAAHLGGDPCHHFNIEAGGTGRRPAFDGGIG